MQKFLKHEAFLMSWKDHSSVGDGRSSIWLTPTLAVYFKFEGGRLPSINEEWLLALGKSAESSTGLIVTREDGELAQAGSPHAGGYPGDVRSRRTP